MAGELVLLTGGTGFVGSAILVELLRSGYRVRVAARSQAKIDRVRVASSICALEPPSTQLMFTIIPDMTAAGAYDDAVQGVDFIIHAAAPLHASEGVPASAEDQLEDAFVTTSVNGSLGILRSAHEKCDTVKRIVMTSSTVAIAPPEVYIKDSDERKVVRGPETRVAVMPPPYNSPLEAYCAAKAAALNASEAFIRTNATSFDMISIMPSLIFGKDELASTTAEMTTGSTLMLMNGLLTGNQTEPAIGNSILNSDVALAHVKALDPKISGNQSFVLNIAAKWEDTPHIAKTYFPAEFDSGYFQAGGPRATIPVTWDSSKAESVLGIKLAGYDAMIKEVVEQYLEAAKRELK